MSRTARTQAIDEFRDNPNRKIMIASLKCGGVGLNLTMASRVLLIENWWNKAAEQQGNDHLAICSIPRC